MSEAEDVLLRAGYTRSADGKCWVPPVNRYAAAYFKVAAALRDARQNLWMAQMCMDAESRKVVRDICGGYDQLLSDMERLVK